MYERFTPSMNEPDESRDYLESMQRKLHDPEEYLRFLELKLGRSDEAPLESGVRPIERTPPE